MSKVCSAPGCGRRLRFASGPRGKYDECIRHRACEVADCRRDVFVKTLCATHYKRWKAHGDPLPEVPVVEYRTGCSVVGCTRRHAALGLCSTHWQLQRRNGTPEYRAIMRRRVSRDGYVEILAPIWAGRSQAGCASTGLLWHKR